MRLIDADALSESIRNGSGTAIQKFFADACVAGAKTVEDVAQVVHGKWIFNDDWWEFICTNCHEAIGNTKKYEYCPHCGAKMDLDDN